MPTDQKLLPESSVQEQTLAPTIQTSNAPDSSWKTSRGALPTFEEVWEQFGSKDGVFPEPKDCPKCAGSGHETVMRGAFKIAQPCVCQTLALRLARVGFGKEHAGATLLDFTLPMREVIAQKSILDTESGILLSGTVGVGKTHLMAALCAEWLKRNRRVRFYIAPELFRRINATYREDSQESTNAVISDLATVDILAVDDIGMALPSEAERRVVHEILSKRNAAGKVTVVTTNLPLRSTGGSDDIEKLYGPPIASRMSAWMLIPMRGADRRAK